MTSDPNPEPDDAGLIARLARCAAELYRDVPREGAGLTSQAREIAHAADLDLLADALDLGADVDLDDVLEPADIDAVCRLLIGVRRSPLDVSEAERMIARTNFPEVDADSLDPLERLIGFYSGLLRDG